ncbi:MAG: response regulator [bacterium]|nr:response regulator [bacterium]
MESSAHYKIFLIDDDTFLLNMYTLKFSKSGFEVTTAQHGIDVIKKLKDGFVPDIMLLDIIMPGIDGLDLLEEIRKEKLIPDTVVIMLTNQSDTTDIEKAKSLGVSGYIVKATTVPSEVIQEVLEIYNKNNKTH